MKKIIYLIMIFSLTSCMTVSRIEKNCDKFSQICVTETVKETVTEYRDTTIYIEKPIYVALPSKDSVRIRDSVRIVDNQAQLAPVHREIGIIGVDAGVINSELLVDAYLTDSTLLVPYKDSVVTLIKEVVKTDVKYIELPPERYIPKFYKFTFWFALVVWVLVLAWLAIKIFKFKIPIKLNLLK